MVNCKSRFINFASHINITDWEGKPQTLSHPQNPHKYTSECFINQEAKWSSKRWSNRNVNHLPILNEMLSLSLSFSSQEEAIFHHTWSLLPGGRKRRGRGKRWRGRWWSWLCFRYFPEKGTRKVKMVVLEVRVNQAYNSVKFMFCLVYFVFKCLNFFFLVYLLVLFLSLFPWFQLFPCFTLMLDQSLLCFVLFSSFIEFFYSL